jgi:hypothetical protein
MPDVMSMIGKEVEVVANGTVYKGTLIEVSESEVHIKMLLQWLSLPASSVMEIRLVVKSSASGLGATFPVEGHDDDVEEIHEVEEIEEPES